MIINFFLMLIYKLLFYLKKVENFLINHLKKVTFFYNNNKKICNGRLIL